MADLDHADGAMAVCVQLGGEIAQDRVGVATLVIDQGGDIAFGMEHGALSVPYSFDFAVAPDLGAIGQPCRSCLMMSCGSQDSACESDPNCVETLNCAVADSCHAQDPTSPGFASCIDVCMSNEGLTFAQQLAVFQELSALAGCYGACQAVCGG